MVWNLRVWIRVALILLLVYLFVRAGLPIYAIVIFMIIIIGLIFLRGKLYKKIDQLLTRHFKFLSSVKPWVKKLIIMLVFILAYLVLRELIYFILGLFGIDIQHALMNINQTVNSSG